MLSVPVWKLFLNKLQLQSKKHSLIFAIVALFIAFTVYFISIYPTGILIPPLRVTNIAIVFLFSAFALLVVWASEKFTRFEKAIQDLLKFRTLLMISAIFFAIVTPTKFQQLLSDLVAGRAAVYNKAMYSRYTLLKTSNSKDTCYVPGLINVPRTIVAIDVSGPVSEDIGLIFKKSFKVKIVAAK